MVVAKHIPALQILIPFFGALLSILSFRPTIAWFIAVVSSIIGLILSIQAMPFALDGMFYSFGGWTAPIGIEYRLDALNQPLIIFINFVLLFILIFGKELIDKTITGHIDNRNQHVFYALLLFAHAGYLGVISTNDLFNLYVFIEISSLATYVLMAKGQNSKSLIGAFDYLILGTIGATLILIGIGFLLAITGSLNVTDISNILQENKTPKIIITASAFFLSGAILKLAFFPMHFWMIRAYSSVASFMLTYLAAISSIIGVYIILRFMYFTVDREMLVHNLSLILRPAAMITIVICTFLALKSDNFKKVIIYSAASQIGYIFLLMSLWSNQGLLIQLIMLDAINKIALFTITAHIEHKEPNLKLKKFKSIEKSTLFQTLAALALIFSAGIPLSSMFLAKIKLLDILLESSLNLEFIIVLLGSLLAILYHLKLAKAIFFSSSKNGTIRIQTKLHGLTAIIIVQIFTLIYNKNIVEILSNAESIIVGG